MKNELENFVNTLVAPTKIAASDLDHLSVEELERIVTLDLSVNEPDAYLKRAYAKCVGESGDDSWLEQFAGTPLHAKAVQLAEQELELEKQELEARIARQEAMRNDGQDQIWTQRDMLRLEKSMLALELHKGQAGGAPAAQDPTMAAGASPAAAPAEVVVEEPVIEPAAPAGPPAAASPAPKEDKPGKTPPRKEGKTPEKTDKPKDEKTAGARLKLAAEGVQMVGQIANGDPNQPTWPRAALGVDAAGRRATPAEETAQAQVGTDVQHTDPKTAGAATQLGTAVMKHIDRAPSLVQRGVGAAHNLGARALGAKTTEQAVGRGLLAAGGAAAGVGALATRSKSASALLAAVEGRPGFPFTGPEDVRKFAAKFKEKLAATAIERGMLAVGGTALAAGVGREIYKHLKEKERKKKAANLAALVPGAKTTAAELGAALRARTQARGAQQLASAMGHAPRPGVNPFAAGRPAVAPPPAWLGAR